MGPSYKEYDDVHMQNLNVHEFTCEQGSLSAAAIIDKVITTVKYYVQFM